MYEYYTFYELVNSRVLGLYTGGATYERTLHISRKTHTPRAFHREINWIIENLLENEASDKVLSIKCLDRTILCRFSLV